MGGRFADKVGRDQAGEPTGSREHLIYIAVMRRRVVSTLVMGLALFLLGSCGSSDGPTSNDSGEPSSNDDTETSEALNPML